MGKKIGVTAEQVSVLRLTSIAAHPRTLDAASRTLYHDNMAYWTPMFPVPLWAARFRR
ncbi:uncharacterized protein MYCFIDRAFT_182151 [Pseudocercospora fijiensis CIRAD86]|uniref:Uncharacterized protein n=1 Tax=Pseudocercospora fijiensis (strain CIRAD86) TaxID=383855 RepID=M3BD65_PSEFD|nr:uncharacterized protein MYCFIDRAFT_182151 [Pseudocercospora fijiensis CIRAD86]EME87093.1 hypothetical protein MYCFIDRAFT_202756 [Pseudocercospora fijiensis CIRAD86]